jgi:CRP/FNR family transcriptional regulator
MHTPVPSFEASQPTVPLRHVSTALPARAAADGEAVIRQACRPASISADAASALGACAIARAVRAGELVLARGEPANAAWLVGSGSVALGTRGAGGLLQHRRSVGAGQWLDLGSVLCGGAYAEDAVAENDGVVWCLPADALQAVGENEPQLLAALARVLALQVHALVGGTRELMTKDVQARCATWLLEQREPDECDPSGRRATVRLQQRKRSIALQLGTTAETFSRTLRQLSEQGLIEVDGYAIALHDLDGLQRLAAPRRGSAPAVRNAGA